MESRQNIRVTQSQRLQLNLGLQTSIRILKADAEGLTRYLEEQAAENPHLRLAPPPYEPTDWLPRWERAFAGGGFDPDLAASVGPSLMAHVTGRIAAMGLPPAQARIADALADALEPSGWLGRALPTIAAECAVPLVDAETVLKRLQSIEPVGLFARSLSECLLLQAIEARVDDAALRGILDHLPLMAAGDVTRLSRILGVASEQVLARFRTIRSFDPKPGAQFAALAAPVREPDLIARHKNGWTVTLNPAALPALSITPGRGDGRGAARMVVRMVESRNTTLLRVGTEILLRQAPALEHGMARLLPLTMADVARTLDLHQSTISRIVAGTSVDTPKGTLWLRDMFSAKVGPAPLSATAIRTRLSALVRHEDAAHPLSDIALADTLLHEGVTLARRTIAKYRDMLGIPPAHLRRKGRA